MSRTVAFGKLLSEFRVFGLAPCSHTSMANGKFSVPSDRQDEFLQAYSEAVAVSEQHMVERHKQVGPIIVDLDFKFDAPSDGRRFTVQHVQAIVHQYGKAIAGLLDAELPTHAVCMCKPELDDKSKDGLHIVFPDVVTPTTEQHLLRCDVLKRIGPILEELGLKPTNSWFDVVDEAVIERNGWTLYGSRKVGCQPYKVGWVFSVDAVNPPVDITDELPAANDFAYWVPRLSIRNKYATAAPLSDRVCDMYMFEEALKVRELMKQNRLPAQDSVQDSKFPSRTVSDLATFIIPSIPPKYAETYEHWYKVVFAIRNTVRAVSTADDARDEFMDLVHVFSELCPDKYDRQKVTRGASTIWSAADAESKLGIGSLIMWMRESDAGRAAYTEMTKNDERGPKADQRFANQFCAWARANPGVDQVLDVYKQVEGGLGGYAYDGSKVFRIDDTSGRYIMFEKDDQWKKEIGAKVKSVVLPLWEEFRERFWDDPPSEYITVSEKGKQNVKYLTWRKDLDNTSRLLNESVGFMGRVAEAYKIEVFDPKMSSEEGLDTRSHLIGFDNGVIDLSERDAQGRFVFRKARLDEYVSKSAGYDYEFIDEKDKRYKRCYDVVKDLFVRRHPNPKKKSKRAQYGEFMTEKEDPSGYETLKCAMMLICSNLWGGNNIQSLIMLVGLGSNGKSVLINLIRAAMGGYCAVLPGWFWEATRKSSEAGAPFMLSLRGARFAFTMEISSDAKTVLNVQLMKNITGGDEQAARYLFDNLIHRFFVDALPIWCVNNIPENWSEKGHAATRRPKGIDFQFRYDTEENELDIAKMADEQLESREFRRSHGLPMFHVMLHFFKKYRDQVPFVKKPMSKQMIETTGAIKNAIDEYAVFVREKLSAVSDGSFFVPVKFLLSMYKEQGGNAKVDEKQFGKAIAAEIREMTGIIKSKAERARIGYDGFKGQEYVWYKLILKDAADAEKLAERLGETDRRAALVAAYEARTEVEDGQPKYAKVGKVPEVATTESSGKPYPFCG